MRHDACTHRPHSTVNLSLPICVFCMFFYAVYASFISVSCHSVTCIRAHTAPVVCPRVLIGSSAAACQVFVLEQYSSRSFYHVTLSNHLISTVLHHGFPIYLNLSKPSSQYIYIYIYILCVHSYMYIYIYIYIYIYMHTHTHCQTKSLYFSPYRCSV
jgi:hypothetical protein